MLAAAAGCCCCGVRCRGAGRVQAALQGRRGEGGEPSGTVWERGLQRQWACVVRSAGACRSDASARQRASSLSQPGWLLCCAPPPLASRPGSPVAAHSPDRERHSCQHASRRSHRSPGPGPRRQRRPCLPHRRRWLPAGPPRLCRRRVPAEDAPLRLPRRQWGCVRAGDPRRRRAAAAAAAQPFCAVPCMPAASHGPC